MGTERFGLALRGLRTARGLPLRQFRGITTIDAVHLGDVELSRRASTAEIAAAVDAALDAGEVLIAIDHGERTERDGQEGLSVAIRRGGLLTAVLAPPVRAEGRCQLEWQRLDVLGQVADGW